MPLDWVMELKFTSSRSTMMIGFLLESFQNITMRNTSSTDRYLMSLTISSDAKHLVAGRPCEVNPWSSTVYVYEEEALVTYSPTSSPTQSPDSHTPENHGYVQTSLGYQASCV